jgi:hypothetical protein
MADLTPSAFASLAFWSRNMTWLRAAGTDWPGFSYTDAEWARMRGLSQTADGRFMSFLFVNTCLFLVWAVLGIAILFMPLATLLYPPGSATGIGFAALLFGAVAAIVAGGLPVTMQIAAFLVCDSAMKAKLVPLPGDAELAAKVRWQFWRIMLIVAVIMVIGTLFALG